MDNTQHEEGGGLLVGAARIKAYLIKTRGMPPTTDPYYLRSAAGRLETCTVIPAA